MEILDTVEVMAEWANLVGALLIIASIVLVFITILLLVIDKNYGVGAVTGFACLMTGLLIALVMAVQEPAIQHTVLITDMSVFDFDKYEIIDQSGKLFTIKEIK